MKKSLVYSLLTITLFIRGYFFLRFAYNASDKFPFTREVISALLCTIATVSITALLIGRQIEAELSKEQVIKYIEPYVQHKLILLICVEITCCC
jgi:hypothetical protein